MYTIEQYTNDNISLVDSLVVKLSATAEQINRTIASMYGIKIDEDDPYSWRYYLNISGRKHITNERVEMTLVETDETVELTRETLLKYPSTLRELLTRGEYYMVLINKYPKDISYINGCLNPIDIEVAINAADGTILTYNNLLIGTNEYDVIDGLELYIKGFLNRWFIEEYAITDNLYISSVLGVLYSNLPNKVSNLRLQNINTNKVSKFHLEHFFRSRYDLWDEVSVLNDTSVMWLYKNLDYVMQNIGKQKTFTKLIDNVFENNQIGVGEILLDTAGIVPVSSTDIHSPAYKKTVDNFIAKKLNPSYGLEHNSVYSLKSVLLRENIGIIEEDSHDLKFLHQNVQNRINKNTQFAQKTKLLDINKFKESKMHNIDIFQLVLEYLAIYSINNKYTPVYRYVDVTTNKNYDITPYEGYLLILKNLFVQHNIRDYKLDSLETSYILDNKENYRNKSKNLFDVAEFVSYHAILHDKYPVVSTGFYTSQEFGRYITECIDFLTTSWIYSANSENAVISANIRLITERAIVKNKIDFKQGGVSKTLDVILAERNIEIEMSENYDHNANIARLLELFTNIDIFKHNEVTEITNKYVSLLTKLSTYTSQVTVLKDEITEMNISYTHLAVINSSVGFINITAAGVSGALESPDFKLACLGNSYIDKLSNYNMKNIPFSYENIQNNNYGYAVHSDTKELNFDILKPKMSIVITNKLLNIFAPVTKMNSNDYIPTVSFVYDKGMYLNRVSTLTHSLVGVATLADTDEVIVSYNKPFVIVNDVLTDFQLYAPYVKFTNSGLPTGVNEVYYNDTTITKVKTLSNDTVGNAIDDGDEFTFTINKPSIHGYGYSISPVAYYPSVNFESTDFNFEPTTHNYAAFPKHSIVADNIGYAFTNREHGEEFFTNKPNLHITDFGAFKTIEHDGVAYSTDFIPSVDMVHHSILMPSLYLKQENLDNQLGYAVFNTNTAVTMDNTLPIMHVSDGSVFLNDPDIMTNFDGVDFDYTVNEVSGYDNSVNHVKTIKDNEIITYTEDLHDSETILITTTPRMVIEMD